MHKVAIIGGGPVGCLLHRLLRNKGINSILIEKNNASIKRIACTGIISERLLSLYSSDINQFTKYQFSDLLLRFEDKEVYRGRLPSNRSFVLKRNLFEYTMQKMACDCGDALLNTKVERVEVCKDKVLIHIIDRSYSRSVIFADLAVASCGYKSAIDLRLRKRDEKQEIIAVQSVLSDIDVSGPIQVCIFPQKNNYDFAWLVPYSKNKAMIGELKTNKYSRDLNKSIIKNFKIEEQNLSLIGGKIFSFGLTESICPRVILIGEAGGHIKPLTGGGLGYGAIAAHVLANLIEPKANHSEIVERFRDYSKDAFASEIRFALRFRSLAPFLRDLFLRNSNFCKNFLTTLPCLDFDFHSHAFKCAYKIICEMKNTVMRYSTS